MTDRVSNDSDQLIERSLGLESLEVTEALLDLCGAAIDRRALPLLKQRLLGGTNPASKTSRT